MGVKDFALKLLQEGREYIKLLLPIVLAWHIPSPKYGKDK